LRGSLVRKAVCMESGEGRASFKKRSRNEGNPVYKKPKSGRFLEEFGL